MANSRKDTRKPGNVAQFPPPENAVAVAEPPEAAEPTTEAPQPAPSEPKRNGRPRKTDPPVETDFFQRVAAVPAADWGTRVYLYLYQIEPVCDLKQSGGKAYLMRYQEAVRDEHQVMLEQGSGKYRLVLAYNKISPQASNELARYDFEIYNPKYPPKIPREVWISDPRNRRWEALLPKEIPATAATAASTIVDAMKMVSDIRRDVREEMEPEPQDTQSPSEMVQTFKAIKEILAPAAATAAATKDPIELATALATTMMQMKADNPVVDILRDELKAMREEAAKMREREFDLQKQVLEAKSKPAEPQKSFLDQITELAALGDKLEPIKKLFGFGNGTSAEVGRAARTTGLDVVRDLVTGPAGERLAQGIGVLISNLASATGPAQNPAMPRPTVISAAQPNGTTPPAETPEQRINRIGETVTRPMLYEYFFKGASGQDWAQSMFDMWPEDYVFMRALGHDNLVNRYRQFAPAWAIIQAKETEFIEFMRQFCAWDPNAEEGPDQDDDGVTALDQEAAS